MTVPNGDIAPEVLRVLSLDLRSLLAAIKNGFNTCEQIISYGIYESAQLNNGLRGIFKLNASHRSFCFIEHNQVSAGYKVNNSCTKSSLQSYAYQILYALAESPLSIQFPGQGIAISVS